MVARRGAAGAGAGSMRGEGKTDRWMGLPTLPVLYPHATPSPLCSPQPSPTAPTTPTNLNHPQPPPDDRRDVQGRGLHRHRHPRGIHLGAGEREGGGGRRAGGERGCGGG